MTIALIGTYPIESAPGVAAPSTVSYVPQGLGDLVVIDVCCVGAGAASAAPTAVSGGGCGNWVPWGTTVTASTGFVVATARFLGIITSGVGTTVTASVTFAATPLSCKIDVAMLGDLALRPNVAWSIPGDAEAQITTAATTMAGYTSTSTTANAAFYTHWLPQQAGAVGSTAGFTYIIDSGSFSNVMAFKAVTSIGAVASASALQSPAGAYVRRATLFQAAASILPTLHPLGPRPAAIGRASTR